VTTASGDDSPSTSRPSDVGPQLRSRPHVLHGYTYRAPTPVGTAFVTINIDADRNICEVFVTVGRAGSDIAADAEALGRPISLAFRIPTSLTPHQVVEAVIDQLTGIGGSSSLGFGANRVRSLADAVAQVLAEHSKTAHPLVSGIPNGDVGQSQTEESQQTNPNAPRGRTGDFCPSCDQMTLGP
jgi:ribonucleoside-diphosphate reductase alpha chain